MSFAIQRSRGPAKLPSYYLLDNWGLFGCQRIENPLLPPNIITTIRSQLLPSVHKNQKTQIFELEKETDRVSLFLAERAQNYGLSSEWVSSMKPRSSTG
jgi:hypothetical protein